MQQPLREAWQQSAVDFAASTLGSNLRKQQTAETDRIPRVAADTDGNARRTISDVAARISEWTRTHTQFIPNGDYTWAHVQRTESTSGPSNLLRAAFPPHGTLPGSTELQLQCNTFLASLAGNHPQLVTRSSKFRLFLLLPIGRLQTVYSSRYGDCDALPNGKRSRGDRHRRQTRFRQPTSAVRSLEVRSSDPCVPPVRCCARSSSLTVEAWPVSALQRGP